MNAQDTEKDYLGMIHIFWNQIFKPFSTIYKSFLLSWEKKSKPAKMASNGANSILNEKNHCVVFENDFYKVEKPCIEQLILRG